MLTGLSVHIRPGADFSGRFWKGTEGYSVTLKIGADPGDVTEVVIFCRPEHLSKLAGAFGDLAQACDDAAMALDPRVSK